MRPLPDLMPPDQPLHPGGLPLIEKKDVLSPSIHPSWTRHGPGGSFSAEAREQSGRPLSSSRWHDPRQRSGSCPNCSRLPWLRNQSSRNRPPRSLYGRAVRAASMSCSRRTESCRMRNPRCPALPCASADGRQVHPRRLPGLSQGRFEFGFGGFTIVIKLSLMLFHFRHCADI